jgi:hypothetical protein
VRAAAIAIAAVTATTGCRQILGIDGLPPADPDASDVDAPPVADAAVDAAIDHLAPWGPPILLSTVSSNVDDSDPSLTGDLLELYFSSARPGGLGGRDVWRSNRLSPSDPWGTPVNVVELSSTFEDSNAEVSLDGLVVYITSGRAGAGLGIYVATRATRGIPWNEPIPVPELDSSNTDYIGNLDGAQLRIVVGSNRPGGLGSFDTYAATRATIADTWSTPVLVPVVNTADDDFGAHQSYDATVLYFTSNRAGGPGMRDIYVATPTTLVPIVELCSTAIDDDPWVSPDGRTILFASDRLGGTARDLYVATR